MKDDPKGRPLAWLAGGALLVAGSTWLQVEGQQPYARILIAPLEAEALFADQVHPWTFLGHRLADLVRELTSCYFFPVALLLLPGIYCLGQAVARAGWKWPAARPRRLLLPAAAALLAALLLLHFRVVGDAPVSGDESAYLFHSQILAQGRLYVSVPPMAEYFDGGQRAMVGEKWFTQFQLGWPSLLALGRRLGAVWAVNPLLSLLSLGLMFWMARELFGDRAALGSAALFACSPFFLLNAATYQIHPSVGWLMLGSLVLYTTGLSRPSTMRVLLSGLAAAYLAATRLQEAPVLLPYFILATLNHFRQGPRSLLHLQPLLVMGLSLLGVGAVLFTNWATTGDPMTMPHHAVASGSTVGFGQHGHTLPRALWNLALALALTLFWMPVLFGTLAFMGARNPLGGDGPSDWPVAGLLGGALINVVFYAHLYSLGIVAYGPRYFSPAILMGLLLAGRGLERAALWLSQRIDRLALGEAHALLLGVILVVTLGRFFPLARAVHRESQEFLGPKIRMEQFLASRAPRCLVLVRSAAGRTTEFLRNDPELKAPMVYAYFLDPDRNQELLAWFPDRKAFVVSYEPGSSSYSVRPLGPPGTRTARELSEDYLFAGLNYLAGLKQPQQAKKMFQRAHELNPASYRPLAALGGVHQAVGELEEAASAWAEALELEPNLPQVRLRLGMAYRALGREREAREQWRWLLDHAGGSPQARTARDLMEPEAPG